MHKARLEPSLELHTKPFLLAIKSEPRTPKEVLVGTRHSNLLPKVLGWMEPLLIYPYGGFGPSGLHRHHERHVSHYLQTGICANTTQ